MPRKALIWGLFGFKCRFGSDGRLSWELKPSEVRPAEMVVQGPQSVVEDLWQAGIRAEAKVHQVFST